MLRDDFDLDWGRLRTRASSSRGRFGLLVPTTPALGEDAVATADVVVCPGVAVDRQATGSGEVAAPTTGPWPAAPTRCLRVQLVYDDEVVDDVPAEAHDQRVDVIVTPTDPATGRTH